MKKDRDYVISVEMNDECSEYDLVCYKDGVLFRKKEEYSLGDCLFDLYEFERSIYDEEKVDCRFDGWRVKIDIFC